MRVLFLAAEVAPFSKTGGLGDVAGALPAALAARGHQVTVVTPLYREVKERGVAVGLTFSLRFPFGEVRAGLREVLPGPGHRVLLLDAPDYFDRDGLYQGTQGEYPDNHRRFGFFSIAALSAAERLGLGFEPQVIHLNDWQTGLAALALTQGFSHTALGQAKSVFTIHNLAYQGNFSKAVMDDLGVPWSTFHPGGVEFYDRVSFLKAGLSYADAVTTVSPTYAKEIQTPEGGNGLDGLLRSRSGVLQGLLNGVDYREWNPQSDRHLPASFSRDDLGGKAVCKSVLRRRFELGGDAQAPLFGVVSRLTGQKGVDLLLEAMPALLERGGEAVVLGSGEAVFERALLQLKARYPGRTGVELRFDEPLAHLIEAGADFFLMPSRYEPCGLNQLYSLRYGTVPVVRATGGLEDTVVDLAEPLSTGVKFREYQGAALVEAIDRALALYRDLAALSAVRQRAMGCDFSWDVAASRYERLYRSLKE